MEEAVGRLPTSARNATRPFNGTIVSSANNQQPRNLIINTLVIRSNSSTSLLFHFLSTAKFLSKKKKNSIFRRFTRITREAISRFISLGRPVYGANVSRKREVYDLYNIFQHGETIRKNESIDSRDCGKWPVRLARLSMIISRSKLSKLSIRAWRPFF